MLQVQSIQPLPNRRTPQQRLTTIVIVAGLHLAVVTAFIIGLKPSLIFQPPPPPILARILNEQPRPTPVPKDLPPITLTRPQTTVDVPKPIIQIETPRDQSTVTDVKPLGGAGNAPVTDIFIAARALASTHTIPPYPPIETRLGHEGDVLLKLSIGADGSVVDAKVERSSGYESLDAEAANWVKTHWRYRPATQGGAAVASVMEVTVAFRLLTH